MTEDQRLSSDLRHGRHYAHRREARGSVARGRAAPARHVGERRAPASHRAAERAVGGGEGARPDERGPCRRRAGVRRAPRRRRSGAASSPPALRPPRLRPRLVPPRAAGRRSTRASPRPRSSQPRRRQRPVAEAWDHALDSLPSDWSDLLCALDLDSSALLPRAALLTAPLNPARDKDRIGFTFRCARRAGYGVSPTMARRCFERLDEEGIRGRVAVLRAISDADNAATQGAVWYVGGKAL